MKSKIIVILWNAFVNAIPIVLPYLLKHKGIILNKVKKMKVKPVN